MSVNVARLSEIIFGLVAIVATIYGLTSQKDITTQVLIFAAFVLTVLVLIILYLSSELNKIKDRMKDVQNKLDLKEALHNINLRLTMLEFKMNKKGRQDLVQAVGVVLLIIILYIFYVLISGRLAAV